MYIQFRQDILVCIPDRAQGGGPLPRTPLPSAQASSRYIQSIAPEGSSLSLINLTKTPFVEADLVPALHITTRVILRLLLCLRVALLLLDLFLLLRHLDLFGLLLLILSNLHRLLLLLLLLTNLNVLVLLTYLLITRAFLTILRTSLLVLQAFALLVLDALVLICSANLRGLILGRILGALVLVLLVFHALLLANRRLLPSARPSRAFHLLILRRNLLLLRCWLLLSRLNLLGNRRLLLDLCLLGHLLLLRATGRVFYAFLLVGRTNFHRLLCGLILFALLLLLHALLRILFALLAWLQAYCLIPSALVPILHTLSLRRALLVPCPSTGTSGAKCPDQEHSKQNT